MAEISTELKIIDSMTSPLATIVNNMQKVIENLHDIDTGVDQAFDPNPIDQAYADINRIKSEMEDLAENINHAAINQNKLNDKIHESTNSAVNFGDSISRIGALMASAFGAQKVLALSDDMSNMKARLNLMNDGLQTTPELMDMVYRSAQSARGSFGDMATVVAKFGNNAKDAFSSSAEVVAFANLVQKQMTIAGASTQESANTMLQLSQALGSGVLRGDELNSIFEQAPNLIQSIADYMEVPIGKIREIASEGKLSADIVKNAMFASADDINAKFEQMPMTWAQAGTMMFNKLVHASQPVLDVLSAVIQHWETLERKS